MATTKITITVPNGQLIEIKKRVASREAASVSGFVHRAVQKSLENEAEFRAMIDEGLAATRSAAPGSHIARDCSVKALRGIR